MIFLLELVAFALLTGLGFVVLRIATALVNRGLPHLSREDPRPFLEWAAYSFLCGIVFTGLIGHFFIWIDARLTPEWWMILGGVAAVGIAVCGILDRAKLGTAWRRFRDAPLGFLPQSPVDWILMLLTLIALLWSIRLAFSFPVIGWDPLSFWYLKTQILFHEGTTHTPDFLAINRVHAHTDYPILVNIVEAGLSHAVGGFRESTMKAFLVVWQAACLAVAGFSMTRNRGSRIGWAVVALIALLPAVLDFDTTGAVSGYRDAPLALLILAAGCLWCRCVESRRFSTLEGIVLVFLLVLIIGTKREGSVWALVLGATAVLAVGRPRVANSGNGEAILSVDRKSSIHRMTWAALLFVVLPFVLLLPWFAVRMSLPFPRSENFAEIIQKQTWLTTGERATLVLREFRNELFLRIQKWGVLWWVFVAVGVWRRWGWSHRIRLLVVSIPVGWMMAAVGFVFTPWGSPLMHLAVSVDRLVIQGALLAIWLLVLNLTSEGRVAKSSELAADAPAVPIVSSS